MSPPAHELRNYAKHDYVPTITFKEMNISEHLEQVEDVYAEQASLYRLLNHPVRLAILDILRDGEQCVCHMEASLGLRQAYISQHLMLLREAGLVTDRRDGWNIFYHVTRREIYKVTDAMSGLTGQSKHPIAHRHGPSDCPCPKCNP